MGKYFRLDDSIPCVADAIRQTATKKQDFATHAEIVAHMMNDPESRALLDASYVRSPKAPDRIASRMIAWFSKGFTSNGPRCERFVNEFDRKKIGGRWAYKLKD